MVEEVTVPIVHRISQLLPVRIRLQRLVVPYYHQQVLRASECHVHSPVVIQKPDVTVSVRADCAHDDDVLFATLKRVNCLRDSRQSLVYATKTHLDFVDLGDVGADEVHLGRIHELLTKELDQLASELRFLLVYERGPYLALLRVDVDEAYRAPQLRQVSSFRGDVTRFHPVVVEQFVGHRKDLFVHPVTFRQHGVWVFRVDELIEHRQRASNWAENHRCQLLLVSEEDHLFRLQGQQHHVGM